MCEEGEARARLKILKILARRRSGSVKFTWCFYRNRNGNGNGKLAPRAAQYEYGFSAAPHAHPQPAAALSSALSADRGPGGAKDFAAEPASSSVVHTSDDPGGGADDDDPGGGSTNSAEDVSAMVSALNVSNTSKTSSSPLLSSFATGLSLSSSRVSSSVEATDAELDESDDEDFEYKGHFCSGCSIPLPGAVRGWVRGFGGVGCWVVGSWTWVCVLRRLRLRV